jgi:hypothetical protein
VTDALIGLNRSSVGADQSLRRSNWPFLKEPESKNYQDCKDKEDDRRNPIARGRSVCVNSTIHLRTTRAPKPIVGRQRKVRPDGKALGLIVRQTPGRVLAALSNSWLYENMERRRECSDIWRIQ